jgi:hypothetical protein
MVAWYRSVFASTIVQRSTDVHALTREVSDHVKATLRVLVPDIDYERIPFPTAT